MPVHLHGTNTLRPFYSSLEDATTLKQVPFCSFKKGFCMISFLKSFGNVIVSSNLRETKGYSSVLTQSLLVATFTQNFMRFHFTVMEISSIPNYLVYSIKRRPTPKVNKLQSPKLRLTQSLFVATFTQNFMRFHFTVMEISSIPNYLVYSIKRRPTPKVNKLQSPKLRLTQSLFVATLTQNFMRFCCTA